MPLTFLTTDAFYEPEVGSMCWYGADGCETVLCKATANAIGSLYRPAELAPKDRRTIFARHRTLFEAAASRKYDAYRTGKQRPILVESMDVAAHHGKFGEFR